MRALPHLAFIFLLTTGCGISHTPDAGASASDGAPVGPLADGALPDGTDGGFLTQPCWTGTAVSCPCPGGAMGFRHCEMGRFVEECECPPPPLPDAGPVPTFDAGSRDADVEAGVPTGSCRPEDPEWCDHLDNDCDGIVDEALVCPDSAIRHTLPWTGFVSYYLHQPIDEPVAVTPFWPEPGPVLAVLPSEADGVLVRPPDGALHYSVSDDDALNRYVDMGAGVEVPTPPCFGGAWAQVFHPDGTLYYGCDGNTIRRDNGLVVDSSTWTAFPAVVGSGQLLLRRGYEGERYVLYDPITEAESPMPHDEWDGDIVRTGHAIVVGDSVFFTVARTYRGGTRYEAVILRGDGPTMTWRVVRRVPISGGSSRYGTFLGLPDGTLLEASISRERAMIFVYPTDGPMRRLFRAPEEGSSLWYNLVYHP